ncbi:MAG: hypothetical protein ACK5MT_04175 [Actinomycetales bacterium]
MSVDTPRHLDRPAPGPGWWRAGTGPAVPGWALALLVYGVARGISAGVTLIAADHQVANLWTPASPGYGEFASMWDAARYRSIAEGGYPVPVPMDAAGRALQSEWAFLPAYPALVRLVMLVTQLPFSVVGPTLSLLFGAGAAVFAYRLFAAHAGPGAALIGVALFSSFPSAPVMQYGYAESLCLFGLLGFLHEIDRRNHPAAAAFAVIACLSRPVGLALVPVAVVHLGVLLRQRRPAKGRGVPGQEPGEQTAWVGAAALVLVSTIAALAWPAIVAGVTGRVDGYTWVQVAWRVSNSMEYFTPWLWMSRYALGAAGPVVLALSVVALVIVLLSAPVRRLGVVMWTWCVSYALYLAAVVDPFSSLPRFALLFVPLALALPRSVRPGRGRLILVVLTLVGFTLAQAWWILGLWTFTPPRDLPP